MHSTPAKRPPLLIWTLQRSGGTNLTRQLERWCGLPAAEHEPFNQERQFGHVMRRWREQPDPVELADGIAAACRQRGLIKHCVELVPWELSDGLAQQASALGWRHLFLYREQPQDRLLSLVFAKRSGVWGPGKLREDLSDVAPVMENALPVKWMLERETLCAQRLNAAWKRLKSLGQKPVAVSYESIYRQPRAAAAATLRQMLTQLDMADDTPPEAFEDFVAQVLGHGDQDTRTHYSAFRGIKRLAEGLKGVPRFLPD